MAATPDILLIAMEVVILLGLLWVVRRSQSTPRTKLIILVIAFFAGISLSLLWTLLSRIMGLLIVGASSYLLILQLRDQRVGFTKPDNIAAHLLFKLTLKGRLVRAFPLLGLAAIITDVLINAVYLNLKFGTFDSIVIGLGLIYLGYNFVPPSYEKERDFVFIFLNLMALILVVPNVVYGLSSGDIQQASQTDEPLFIDNPIATFLLSQPLDTLLSLLGYEVHADGNTLYYQDLSTGLTNSVFIAESCSGIYSLAIFVAAFLAWVATEYQVFDRFVAVLLMLGIITAYIANLFRMAIIVLIGHYRGGEALLWAHANVGWMIFLAWIGVFWWVLFKYLLGPDTGAVDRIDDQASIVDGQVDLAEKEPGAENTNHSAED